MKTGKHQAEKNVKRKRKQDINSKTKKKNKKVKRIIRFLLFLVFIACISYIAYYYINTNKKQKETDMLLNNVEVEESIEEPKIEETERMIQIKELQKQNDEIIGWLEIGGTKINYPVMQAPDNEFYLNHDYKKEKNKQGSLYLDKDYNWSIPSSNLLIYGHNNTLDGSMFADLLKYQEESFYKEHPTFRFTTANEDVEYEIIAVFKSRVYYKNEKNVFRYYYFINAKNEQEYNEFIENCKKISLYNTGKSAKYGEQLITLSTCAYHTKNGRFAVVAKKMN